MPEVPQLQQKYAAASSRKGRRRKIETDQRLERAFAAECDKPLHAERVHPAWQGELSQRVEAYRTRRRRRAPNADQSQFSFDDPSGKTPQHTSAAVAEPPASVEKDFSFTIAIGRPSNKHVVDESRMVIDVSLPPDSATSPPTQVAEDERKSRPGLHPVASIDDRRHAGLIDFCCLMFAYGGFLMLFGSLGGQFTLSK